MTEGGTGVGGGRQANDNDVRVLYLSANADRVSTNVSTEGWLNVLRPRGLHPVLASHQVGPFQVWARQEGIPVYPVAFPLPSKTAPWPFLRSLWLLWIVVQRHRIDLVHCTEGRTYPLGQYLGRLSRLPVVVSVHSRIGRGWGEWAFRGRRQPRRILFVSRGLLEACRSAVEGIVPEDRWRVLYNGLDMEQYVPEAFCGASFRERYGLGSDPLVGTACSFRPVKQLEHLSGAVSRLRTPRVRLLMAGRPSKTCGEYGERLIRETKALLGDRLVYLGWLDDLRGFMNALDLYVSTSSEEAFGVSVLQALACGCPVVGYPSISLPEQVERGCGEIVPQDRIDELAAAVDEWLGNRERLALARNGARRHAEKLFDIRTVSEQLWREYQSVLYPD